MQLKIALVYSYTDDMIFVIHFKKRHKLYRSYSIKSVTTQNFAFFSYWCRKKRLQIHF